MQLKIIRTIKLFQQIVFLNAMQTSEQHYFTQSILCPEKNYNNELITQLLKPSSLPALLYSKVCEASRQNKKISYEGQMIQIVQILMKLNPKQVPQLENLFKSQQWVIISKYWLEHSITVREEYLGGHYKNPQLKYPIFFTKDEVLNHHYHFLKGVKLSSFQEFENYDPSSSDSQDFQSENKNPTPLKYQSNDKNKLNSQVKINDFIQDQLNYFKS